MGFAYPWLSILTISLILVSCWGDNQVKDFVSCLSNHHIDNFTTYYDADYNNLLLSSTNNLRYSGPFVPKPKVIIVPSTKDELVYTVLCCKKASMEIRVRCGGHSYEGTSYVATDGSPFVIIEMMSFDKISIDLENGFVWIEGGATLGQTYFAISRLTDDYTIPAGVFPTVGVGGHISGGGIGLLARKYGLAADNVVDALLIDAEGRVLNRKTMGELVFWAIRGGGGGIWGIVYAWKIKLVAISRVTTVFEAVRSQPKDDVVYLFHKWQFVAPKLEGEFHLVSFIRVVPGTFRNEIKITFVGTYLGKIGDLVATFERVFPELGVTKEICKEMRYVEAIAKIPIPNMTVPDLANRHLKHKPYFKSKYDYVRIPISINGIKTIFDILEKQPKAGLYVEPLGGFMDEIASDAIPFPHRRGTLYAVEVGVEWNKEDNEKSEEYIEWIRKFHIALIPYVSNNPRSSYINCMDLDLGTMNNSRGDEVEKARVWGERYFGKNYNRLVRAKTIIDPHNIFRNQQGIPPMASIRNRSLTRYLCSENRFLCSG